VARCGRCRDRELAILCDKVVEVVEVEESTLKSASRLVDRGQTRGETPHEGLHAGRIVFARYRWRGEASSTESTWGRRSRHQRTGNLGARRLEQCPRRVTGCVRIACGARCLIVNANNKKRGVDLFGGRCTRPLTRETTRGEAACWRWRREMTIQEKSGGPSFCGAVRQVGTVHARMPGGCPPGWSWSPRARRPTTEVGRAAP